MRSMYRRLRTPFPLLSRTIDEIFLDLQFVQEDTVWKRLTALLLIENPFLTINLFESMIRISNLCFVSDQLQLDCGKTIRIQSHSCDPSERLEPIWQDQALVRWAAGLGLHPLLEKLLALSPRVTDFQDPDGWSPHDHALKIGFVSTSALLLQKGAKVDTNEDRGRAATIIISHGTSFVKELISHLALSQGLTSILGKLLASSVCASTPDMIEHLFKVGADLNIKYDDGQDALILASRLDDIDSEAVIGALLRLGATQHCTDHLGRTALHYLSTRSDCKVIVHILLESKAEVNAVDRTGQTPLDFALTFRNYDVAILLQSYGAISLASTETVCAHDDQRLSTSKSSEEWAIDSDEGSVPWESDCAE